MDVVLALTLEWQDPRLTWDPYAWGDTRISEVSDKLRFSTELNYNFQLKLTVKPEEIWTPSIDIANRIHDYSPVYERSMMSTLNFEGTRRNIFDGSIEIGPYSGFSLEFTILTILIATIIFRLCSSV